MAEINSDDGDETIQKQTVSHSRQQNPIKANGQYELCNVADKSEFSNKDGKRSNVPQDRLNLVYIIFLIHGIGTLMPWNMFINAESYFRNYKLDPHPHSHPGPHHDSNDEQLAYLRKHFLSYLGLCSQIPNVLFNGLNLLLISNGITTIVDNNDNLSTENRDKQQSSGDNLRIRVTLTLIGEIVIFSLTILLVVLDSSRWPFVFFYITMLSVIVLNMASGIYQNCIFGTGAKFPMCYTNAILIGSNLSGTFTSCVNLLSIWLSPDPRTSATYYFITALVVLLICLITYNLLQANKFYRHYANLKLNTVSSNINDNNFQQIQSTRKNSSRNNDKLQQLRHKWYVLKKCWPQCLNVFLTFYVTLALFPAILSNISQTPLSLPHQKYDASPTQSLVSTYNASANIDTTISHTINNNLKTNSNVSTYNHNFASTTTTETTWIHMPLTEKYFTPVVCFLFFNVFAMLGNLAPNIGITWPGPKYLWLTVVSRFVFVPFFLFCRFNVTTRTWPVYIDNDWIFAIGNILLALSSGYFSSLCMMFASHGLDNPNEAQLAGMMAAFFLVFGIFCGINSSFLLTWIVEL